MSNKKILLNIATPDKDFFEDEVDMVSVRTTTGDIGVLADHIPLVTVLDIGVIRIHNKGEIKEASLNKGFMKVSKNDIQILTDSAEWPEEIDLTRAEEAKKRAEERLHAKEQVDTDRAMLALKRATNRIDLMRRI